MFLLGKLFSNWAFPEVEAGWWLIHHSPASSALLSINVVCFLDSPNICPSHAAWEVNLTSSVFLDSLWLAQNREILVHVLLKISHTCFLFWFGMQNIINSNHKIFYERRSTFPTQLFAINCKGSLHSLAGSLENNILEIFFSTLNCFF